jgi:lysophospholipase L1-like esterase
MLAALLLGATSGTIVEPYDHRVEYVGRFDRRDPRGPIGSWSAVEAKLQVKGTGMFLTVNDVGPNWLQVVVDGVPTRAVELEPGVQTLEVETPSGGTHLYEFVKRTEPEIGTIQFLQYQPEGKLLPFKHEKRLIQVVGDSISCGYGNEAASQQEHFRPATENAFESYGSIAARQVNSDVQIIAWSGRKMWPDNTIPSIYDLNVPTDSSSIYDFKGEEPEAIVVNLGTNDFRDANPDESQWTATYKAFIERLRYHYPSAVIYAAMGSMMSDSYPEGRNALSTLRSYLTRVVDTQSEEDGLGADWHPSTKTHEKMAIKLELALKHDLHW